MRWIPLILLLACEPPAPTALPTPPPRLQAPAPLRAFTLRLEPRAEFYTRQDHPRVEVKAVNLDGDSILNPEVKWRFSGARFGPEGGLILEREGAAWVEGCVHRRCQRLRLIVDDAPPLITLETPTPDAPITQSADTITLQGRAEGASSLYLNGRPIPLGEGGCFVHIHTLKVGMNALQLEAHDGVRPPTLRALRLLYTPAPVLGPDKPLLIQRAASFRASRGLEAQLARWLEGLLGRLNLYEALPDPWLATGPPVDLIISELSLGTPRVEIRPRADALEVFASTRDAQIRLAPQSRVWFDGEIYPIRGAASLDVAAVAEARLERGRLKLDAPEIALTRLEVEGDETGAIALLEGATPLLNRLISRGLGQALERLLQRHVLDPISTTARDFLDDLNLEARLNARLIPIFQAQSFDVAMRLEGWGEGARGHWWSPPEAPTPPWPHLEGLGIAIRLRAVSALLYRMWRRGALDLDLSARLPPAVRLLVRAARLRAPHPPLLYPSAGGRTLTIELPGRILDLETHGEYTARYTLDLWVEVAARVEGACLELYVKETRLSVSGRPEEALMGMTPRQLHAQIAPHVERGIAATFKRARWRLPSVQIDPDRVVGWAKGLSAAALRPRFSHPPRVDRGWIILEIALEERGDEEPQR